MTEPRPEPVLDHVRLGALVAAAVVAIVGVVLVVTSGRWADLDALGKAVGGAVTAVGALSVYLAPMWQARKARELVTPVADPVLEEAGEHTLEAQQADGDARLVQSILDDEASRSDPPAA